MASVRQEDGSIFNAYDKDEAEEIRLKHLQLILMQTAVLHSKQTVSKSLQPM